MNRYVDSVEDLPESTTTQLFRKFEGLAHFTIHPTGKLINIMLTRLFRDAHRVLAHSAVFPFAKWSRPQSNPNNVKDKSKSRAVSDEKSAKIS